MDGPDTLASESSSPGPAWNRSSTRRRIISRRTTRLGPAWSGTGATPADDGHGLPKWREV